MRSLFLSLVLGLGGLGMLLGPLAPRADAQLFPRWRGYYYTPAYSYSYPSYGYYGAYYTPSYSYYAAPTVYGYGANYYTPAYTYTVPSYSYNYTPSYYYAPVVGAYTYPSYYGFFRR